MNKRLKTIWAVTWGGVGKLPAAGTVASLITLCFIAFIAYIIDITQYFTGKSNQIVAYIIYANIAFSISISYFFAIKKALPLF